MPIWGRCSIQFSLLILLALLKLLVLCLAAYYFNCAGLELIRSWFSLVCYCIGWAVVVVCLTLLVCVVIFSMSRSNSLVRVQGDSSNLFEKSSSNGDDERRYGYKNSEGLVPGSPIGDRPREIHDSFNKL